MSVDRVEKIDRTIDQVLVECFLFSVNFHICISILCTYSINYSSLRSS